MNTNRDLNYQLYMQKQNGFSRTDYYREYEQYTTIQAGDVEQVKQNFEAIRARFMEGKGQLSENPVRNLIYHFVISLALIARFCIEGGMSHDTAYTLGDVYIMRADKCTDCEMILDLFEQMQIDYAERMREIRKQSAISIHVRRCVDFIYENLHQNLTVNTLAKYEKLNPSYLSKLFKREMGIGMNEFIIRARVEAAEDMLRHTDYTYLDIALSLGFSSQSAFISVFKKYKGITPKQYRSINYNSDVTTLFHQI